MGFGRIIAIYRRQFRDHRRERMFLASLSFFVTFGVTRLVTHSFRGTEDPFQISIAGIHVHHLVWGIILLLLVGYFWLIQVGVERNGRSVHMGQISALLYGVGAALTLDEFALWLNLKDVYWERQGRASIDAALLFGALVSAGLWGGPFLRAVTRQLPRILGWSRVGGRRQATVQTPPAIEPAPLVSSVTPVTAPVVAPAMTAPLAAPSSGTSRDALP